jgi:radical SAM protein with 4Fe4S-binding SPASM domain
VLDTIKYKLYRLKYQYAKQLPLTKPVDVSLELVAGCNQSCSYCYFADRKNLPFKQGMMTKELAFNLIDQAGALGVDSIKFNYRGESTMHPHYLAILERAASWKFTDRLTNSNFNFDTKRDDIFMALCTLTKVKVSFDSFRKEIIESVRVGTKYERALANITKFYEHPLRRNTKLVVQAVRTQANVDEDLEYEIKRRWPSAEYSIRDMVEGRVNKDLTNLVEKKRDNSERQSCIQSHARLIIHWDGKVNPCCPAIGNNLIIGDITKQTIKEVWNSDAAKNLRKSLKDKSAFESDPCKSCSSFETYKGYRPPRDS